MIKLFLYSIFIVLISTSATYAGTVSSRTRLAETPASGDLIPIVDVSDTTQSTNGTSKAVEFQYIQNTGTVAVSSLTAATASATTAIGTYTIGLTVSTGGALRIGDISGGNYIEFLDGYVRLIGTYYLQAASNLDGVTADGHWAGENETMTVDASETNTVFGQAYFIASDGELEAASADSSSTLPCIGLAAESGTGSKVIVSTGKIRKDAWNWTQIGKPVYVSSAPGTDAGLTQTAPSTSGYFAQIIGVAESADVIKINISPVLIEVP